MPVPTDLASAPRWYPHRLDPATGQLLIVERSEDDLRAASFLDDRSLKPGEAQHLLAWDEVAAAIPADARRDVQYIFHIGHVGSTLISRLLGELPGVLALREPLLLRTLFDAHLHGAETWLAGRLDPATALLSRCFRPEQRALVKATSFVAEIAPRLVPAGSGALLLYSPAQRYLENILAGEASRRELHALADGRLKRLHRRLGPSGWPPVGAGEAEKAALGWACEMTALGAAAAGLGERARWLDFDAFLAAPAASLAGIARDFGHPCGPADAERLTAGPLMGRYSKALEYEYTPQLRAAVLAQSRAENRAAIAAALKWLDVAGRRFPALAECLERRD
jgi:hypothetical protein